MFRLRKGPVIFLPPVRKRNRRNNREQCYLFHLVAFFVVIPRIEAVVNIVNRKIPDVAFPGILPLNAVRKIVFVSKIYSKELVIFLKLHRIL